MSFQNESNDIRLSKLLSWLLRHGANQAGLELDEGGFIDVNKILTLNKFKKYTVSDIKRVVDENDKKRFTLRQKDNHLNTLQIRANQGHSIKVDDNALLKKLSVEDAPSVVYHGTYNSKLKAINEKGLSRMKRNHIHFSSKLPGDNNVISGMRKNCDVVIAIDVAKAMGDGYVFYESDNGVILCNGNENGCIPKLYFKEIQLRKNDS